MISFESYQIFSSANLEQVQSIIASFEYHSDAEPFGNPGEMYWINEWSLIDDFCVRFALKSEYLIDREIVVAGRKTEPRSIDLVESRLVLMNLSTGLVLVEDRQFRDRGHLNKGVFITQIQDLLNSVLAKAEFEQISLEPITFTTTTAEIREIFFSQQVQSLTISGLRDRQIPANVKIFNPREDAEQLVRELLDEETKIAKLDRVRLEASGPDSDLSKSHLNRALVHAGDPIEATIFEGQQYT